MALYMCQVLHVGDFLGSRRMKTAPTSIEVLLRPTQSQSDEPSDLRGSLSERERRIPYIFTYFFTGSSFSVFFLSFAASVVFCF